MNLFSQVNLRAAAEDEALGTDVEVLVLLIVLLVLALGVVVGLEPAA